MCEHGDATRFKSEPGTVPERGKQTIQGGSGVMSERETTAITLDPSLTMNAQRTRYMRAQTITLMPPSSPSASTTVQHRIGQICPFRMFLSAFMVHFLHITAYFDLQRMAAYAWRRQYAA